RYLLTTLLTLLVAVAVPVAAYANPAPPFVWHDDMEGDVSSWASVDFTGGVAPHFHWDAYLAFDGMSWWCGSFDYDADGGYGDNWDDRLELPEIAVNPVPVEDVSWAALKALYRDDPSGGRGDRSRDEIVPILTFAYRCDSENAYDYTYVEAKDSDNYVRLNFGYDHRVPWTDLGAYGFNLSEYDNPLAVRFRFISDGAWSDEDGGYNSVGGAFAVDNIRVYDHATGEVLFYDSEPGGREGECIPAVPAAAGDYWHLIDRACPAYSDPHSWWCGDDADTSLVPPNLMDGLYSPVVETGIAFSCTTYFAMHFATPTVDNDYLSLHGTTDGVNYYNLGGWWGDMESCDGWGHTAFNTGFDIGQFGGGETYYAGMLFIMHTTDNGCGPAGAGDAGFMLDDLWFCTNGGVPWEGERAANLYDAERHQGGVKSTLGSMRLLRR
ncbi:MAG: hypothetical protein ABIK85_03690, partial [Candidatus Eisenbacteria bacterium]